MDKYYFKYFGYKTNFLINESAKKIQKAYKNYKEYQLKKRIDIIKNLISYENVNYDDEIKEENKYWIALRKKIKYAKNYIIVEKNLNNKIV
tara:strand:+ start:79 stop:351 length:273 start_codon:yes stop_codon:yes gene_type:complete